ncbi:Peptide chain release factor 1 [bacterium HR25]|jgi:peptide chain release factor 1|nr:Peptide chain release factor 1 [bacterium HR25]
MWEKLEEIERRYEELARQMAQPEVAADYERLQALAKEHAALEKVVSLYRQHKEAKRQAEEARAIIAEGSDPELIALAREELERAEEELERLEKELRLALLPKSPLDEKDVIVEIRAAAGGEEAALFAADLFRMYSRYAERQGWEVEVIDRNPSDLGGFKEIIFEVRGKGAYSRLKYESGVHRVQRVPVTEAGGRIHTSTATVAVLPEPDEVDLHVDEKDLRIDVFGASGHGGQHVQKNATAVRITHIPTGIVVVCQDERSQTRNRQRAMQVLRARLLDLERRRQQEQIEATRRAQVGTGERAEKIRTYNFPQDRVTDHRIGLTLHNLEAILDGELDAIIDALQEHEQSRLLEEQRV